MTPVAFTLNIDFDQTARRVWDELIDWKAHEAWIPATRVELHSTDPTAVGATFTATTGYGPAALEDRMEVTECSWDDDAQSGTCEVRKLGPVLLGKARFEVTPTASGCQVLWVEDVEMKYLPGPLSPVAAWIGSAGFRVGMMRLREQLSKAAAAA